MLGHRFPAVVYDMTKAKKSNGTASKHAASNTTAQPATSESAGTRRQDDASNSTGQDDSAAQTAAGMTSQSSQLSSLIENLDIQQQPNSSSERATSQLKDFVTSYDTMGKASLQLALSLTNLIEQEKTQADKIGAQASSIEALTSTVSEKDKTIQRLQQENEQLKKDNEELGKYSGRLTVTLDILTEELENYKDDFDRLGSYMAGNTGSELPQIETPQMHPDLAERYVELLGDLWYELTRARSTYVSFFSVFTQVTDEFATSLKQLNEYTRSLGDKTELGTALAVKQDTTAGHVERFAEVERLTRDHVLFLQALATNPKGAGNVVATAKNDTMVKELNAKLQETEKELTKVKSSYLTFLRKSRESGGEDSDKKAGAKPSTADKTLQKENLALKRECRKAKRVAGKVLYKGPIAESKHKRSKEREDNMAIMRLTKGVLGGKDHNKISRESKLKDVLREMGPLPTSSVKIISSDLAIVRTPEPFHNMPSYVLRAFRPIHPMSMMHISSWHQLIVHDVPLQNFSTIYDMCAGLYRAFPHIASSGVFANTLACYPRILNPLEFFSGKKTASFILCYNSREVFNSAIRWGITLFGEKKPFRTEPVVGYMKNPFNQAGFVIQFEPFSKIYGWPGDEAVAAQVAESLAPSAATATATTATTATSTAA